MNSSKQDHNSCANCPTRHLTEWRDLDSPDLASLDRAKRTRTVAPGMNLYHQGDQADGIYCIQSGLIGLRRIDENGNSSLLKTSSAGTTTGYQAFLSKEPHSNSAEALVPSEVCFIESSSVTILLSDNPKLGERFLQHTFEDLKELEDSYSRSLTLNVKSRFLHLMMVYYRQFGFLDGAGHPAVDIPVTRTDLSELLGIQPESLSRVIKKVQGEGLVQINDRRVIINNIENVLFEAGVTV
jgi:CRP-like cAMP-binding protein